MAAPSLERSSEHRPSTPQRKEPVVPIGRTHADGHQAVIGHDDWPDLNGCDAKHCGHTPRPATIAPRHRQLPPPANWCCRPSADIRALEVVALKPPVRAERYTRRRSRSRGHTSAGDPLGDCCAEHGLRPCGLTPPGAHRASHGAAAPAGSRWHPGRDPCSLDPLSISTFAAQTTTASTTLSTGACIRAGATQQEVRDWRWRARRSCVGYQRSFA